MASLTNGRFGQWRVNEVLGHAICLTLTGRTNKGDNHDEARAEIRGAGSAGRALEPTFHRLLKLKPKSQYQQTSVSASDCVLALDWATRMLDVAKQVVSE